MIFDTFKSLFKNSSPERKFLAPEVIQASAMDCGPATLKCILEGFGISVSYGRLREACQTDVDGTSIDIMEEVACQLGLDAEQVMLPADYFLLPETKSLPAIVIVCLPNGLTHFVVAWRIHGPFVQIMDPGSGRRWLHQKHFLNELYIHTHDVCAKDWREWAGEEEFCDSLQFRMKGLGLEQSVIDQFIKKALKDKTWYSLACMDACLRMVGNIVNANGLNCGNEAQKVIESLFNQTLAAPDNPEKIIPQPFWSVKPAPDNYENDKKMLSLQGAVLVQVSGSNDADDNLEDDKQSVPLSPELIAALEEKPSRPEFEILNMLAKDGMLNPIILMIALAMAVLGVTIEALLFQGILDISANFEITGQRIGAVSAMFIFVIALLVLEIPIASTIIRMGRRLETRLRISFLEKIPRLGDRYFRSRLTSDMTQRVHEIRGIRNLPNLGLNFIRIFFQIILTTAGIILFIPESALIAVAGSIFAIGMSFIAQPVLIEQDLRLRTHVGALSRFYLDALLGLIPIRTHCAERSVRREYEGLMVEWVRTNMGFLKIETLIESVEALGGIIFSIWILLNYIGRGGESGNVLLLFYWTLNLPVLGKSLANIAQQYPMQRSRILRLLEPLGAPEDEYTLNDSDLKSQDLELEKSDKGVSILLDDINVHAGGRIILEDIDLKIQSGEHIAVVGPSGAGKSSLVGLLLGWHRCASGKIFIDGKNLKADILEKLRNETAWIDPEVQLWNRSLFDNLQYGTHQTDISSINEAIKDADIFDVLERLPQGMKTRLGEGGRLISGGEGQRVRLARGIIRPDVRLVILDEPFRGLDREKRRQLLKRARQYWSDKTLIFISHDIEETLAFERVIVIENGKLIEEDSPQNLAQKPDSRYQALLQSEHAVRKGTWQDAKWRKLWLADGKLKEK